MKFLVIGNITKDTIRTKEKEIVTFGRYTSYASITARKLGYETYVLSRGNNELDDWIRSLTNHHQKRMTRLYLECYMHQMPTKARATSNHSHDNNLPKFLFGEDLVCTKSGLQWWRINTTFIFSFL